MSRGIRLGLLMAIMTLAAGGLQADVLNLSDGTRLVGTIEEIDDAEARVSGTFAGELKVPRKTIVSIETDQPITVKLRDGTYLSGQIRPAGVDGQIIQVDGVGQRTLTIADLQGAYKKDPLTLQREALAVKVAGGANVGISLTDGNSNSRNFLLDGEVVTRTPTNRFTISGEYNEEESEDVQIKQNWRGLVKYDHFFSEDWYWFTSATFEHDEFADLDLRSAVAAGAGHQFFETDTHSLSIESGLGYIDENFIVAEDQSFIGLRWAIDYQQQLWDGLWFFHYDEGLLGLEDTDDLTIRSRTGLRMNLTDRLIARLQTTIDWNRSPPPNVKSTDYEHSLTIGYTFGAPGGL